MSTHSDSKDVEIENLRALIKKQASAMKTLKSETTSLRKKTQSSTTLQTELHTLRHKNESLRSTIETLKSEAESQRADFEAINRAMDERLAATLSKMLKERSRAIVGKRDTQWADNVGKLKGEKEFMGKVLMREWGKQECGVVEEKEEQLYRYQYVKRS
jgi:myosin protein heavy chain